MNAYDPQRPDSYAIHLAHLNSAKGVVASRDILNVDGALLVKKGHAIRPETVQRLLNHKLVQPLETSVNVANMITPEQMFTDICDALRRDQESMALHESLAMDEVLREQCQYYGGFPLITQKMTVLGDRLPAQYQKAIYCAWFGLVLAVQMGKEVGRGEAFLAGLAHDTGLLHIAPEIIGKTGNFTPEEWRALQSHPLVCDLFLSYVEGLPSNVRRAVREHHERSDGTGYPAGLFGEKLSLLGQVIAMADTVWAFKNRPGNGAALTLRQAGVVIKLNTCRTPGNIESALYHLLNLNSEPNRKNNTSKHSAKSFERARALDQTLRQRFDSVLPLKDALPAKHRNPAIRSARFKLERLILVVNGSGLLSESVAQWLDPATIDESQAPDMDELLLMYNELEWQMADLVQVLQQSLENPVAIEESLQSTLLSVVRSIEEVEHSGSPGSFKQA